ncbi:hypothetical protein TeGR_g5687, partial [Tetraparma gracilis]
FVNGTQVVIKGTEGYVNGYDEQTKKYSVLVSIESEEGAENQTHNLTEAAVRKVLKNKASVISGIDRKMLGGDSRAKLDSDEEEGDDEEFEAPPESEEEAAAVDEESDDDEVLEPELKKPRTVAPPDAAPSPWNFLGDSAGNNPGQPKDVVDLSGVVRRSEVVDVFILDPQDSTPPTIKDVTVKKPKLRDHVLKAYKNRDLVYSFHESVAGNRKKVQSRRDAVVRRVKLRLLREYLAGVAPHLLSTNISNKLFAASNDDSHNPPLSVKTSAVDPKEAALRLKMIDAHQKMSLMEKKSANLDPAYKANIIKYQSWQNYSKPVGATGNVERRGLGKGRKKAAQRTAAMRSHARTLATDSIGLRLEEFE